MVHRFRQQAPRLLTRAPRRRSALTLVEIVLVLALLVVIASVSTPLLQGSFARASLQNSGDLVRSAWSKARIAAMESGQAQVFRCEYRGSRYLITALDALGTPQGEPPFEELETPDRSPADILRLRENRLPNGVFFVSAEVASSSRVEATLGQMPTGAWSAPIIFHPDGTTTDASLLLANDEEQTLRVTLRGLTGISNAAEVGREPIPQR